MDLKNKLSSLLLAMLLCSSVLAESTEGNYDMRKDYGAKFEPIGNRILHGAGQDAAAFANYIEASGKKPSVSIQYVSPHHDYRSFVLDYRKELESYHGAYIIPQLGMHMNRDEDPEHTYYERIALGKMDTVLERYLTAIASLNRPIFLRIGFEFNGEWNGYTRPDVYVQAFQHTVDMIRELGFDNIAIVWCYNPDGQAKDFMSYYPGDEYVDWWAIDVFDINSISTPHAEDFLLQADIHNKPIMLSECTPYTYYVQQDEAWSGWFVPFFNYIHTHPGIKCVCYINWKWTDYPQWQNWGDARLEKAAASLLKAYQEEINHPIWLHAFTEDEAADLIYGISTGITKEMEK